VTHDHLAATWPHLAILLPLGLGPRPTTAAAAALACTAGRHIGEVLEGPRMLPALHGVSGEISRRIINDRHYVVFGLFIDWVRQKYVRQIFDFQILKLHNYVDLVVYTEILSRKATAL